MVFKAHVRWLAIGALTVLVSTRATAQMTAETNEERYAALERAADQMRAELDRFIWRYWEPRLSGYKVRIDEALGGYELTQLDELRARFAIAVEQMRRAQKERELGASDRNSEPAPAYPMEQPTPPDTVSVPDNEAASLSATPMLPGEADTASAATAGANETAIAEPEPIVAEGADDSYANRYAEERARELDSLEAALERGDPIVGRFEIYGEGAPMMELPVIAKWLARGSRAPLDNVLNRITTDIRSFIDSMDGFMHRYLADHADLVARYPELEQRITDYAGMGEIRELLRHPRYFRELYIAKIEPFVLLYSGETFVQLLGVVTGGNPAADMSEGSMLEQNAPNPASTSTTITYILPEASTETSISIVDAKGRVLMQIDQGAQAAGVHNTTVDVSNLVSGWYLYRLHAVGTRGPRVATRVMQVTQ